MYCVHCGKWLPESGYCTCGALQPGQAPMPEPLVVAELEPLVVTEPEPVVVAEPEPVVIAEPEPVVVAEPEPVVVDDPEPVVVAEPEPVLVADPETVVIAEPEAVEEVVPEQPVWEDIPSQTQPEAPVQPVYGNPYPQQPTYNNPYPQRPVYNNPYQQPAYAQPVYNQPAYQQPAYNAPNYAVQGGEVTPAQAVLSKIAQSPIFMIGTIALSVQLLLSIISSFIPLDIMGMIYSLAAVLENYIPGVTYELEMAMQEVMGELARATTILGLVSLPGKVLPALTVVALWITFISAKKNSVPSEKGLTILQVVQIIGLVGIGLSILGVLTLVFMVIFILVMAVQEMNNYGMSMGDLFGTEDQMATILTVVVVIVVIALLAGVVLNLIYSIKVLTSIIGAKKVIKNGEAKKTASMFVAIWNFVIAAGLVMDLFGKFVLSGAVNGIMTLCTIAAYVLFSLCILQYNKGIKPLLEEAKQPVQQPTYPPYNG